jgi:hypothetical protein
MPTMRFGVTLLGPGFLVLRLSAQTPGEDPLLRWMDKIAQAQLDGRDKEIAAVRSVADAEHRKDVVRRKIMSALGGLPDYKGPLDARITGQIQADGYVIEKVIYESLPGLYVTANLYRPNRPGRYPAVLLQAGHTQEGKATTVAHRESGAKRLRVAGLRSDRSGRTGANLRPAAQSSGSL